MSVVPLAILGQATWTVTANITLEPAAPLMLNQPANVLDEPKNFISGAAAAVGIR